MSVLEQLLTEIAAMKGLKHSTPDGTTFGPMLHGPGGILGSPGVERDIISTRVIPSGLASVLPAIGSVKTNPLYQYITGFTAPVGSQPDDACGDGPVAGHIKSCLQTAQFGRVVYTTDQVEMNKVGQITDRSEYMDHRVVNDPFMTSLVSGIFADLPKDEARALASEIAMRFTMVGAAFQDTLSQWIYTGTGTDYQFPGLELLVSEEHYDARTGTDCPSLASDIRDFGDVNVSSVDGAPAIFAQMLSMYRNLKHNASSMNFGVTDFAFVMREQLHQALADLWACQYNTAGCLPANSNVSIDVGTAAERVALRDAMLLGKYLLIDGNKVPVITDDALAESTVSAGVYSSDIYLLPLSVRGGATRTLFWEYFDFSRGTIPAIREGRLTTDFWSDNGRYLWHKKPPLNWCVQWIGKIEPRIILLTPHLAGRISGVAFEPTRHFRDAYSAGVSYVNGGVTTGYPAPSYYSQWNPPA